MSVQDFSSFILSRWMATINSNTLVLKEVLTTDEILLKTRATQGVGLRKKYQNKTQIFGQDT